MFISIAFATFTIIGIIIAIIIYTCIMGVLPFKYLYERTWAIHDYCIIGILKIIGYIGCIINFILFGALLHCLIYNTYKLQIQDYAVLAISYFGIIAFTEIIRFIEFLIDRNYQTRILLDKDNFRIECNNLVELTYENENYKVIDNHVSLYKMFYRNHSKKINSESTDSKYTKFKIEKYEINNETNSCNVYLKIDEKVKYDLFE